MLIDPVSTQDVVDLSVEQIEEIYYDDEELNPDPDDAFDVSSSVLEEFDEEEFAEDCVFFF